MAPKVTKPSSTAAGTTTTGKLKVQIKKQSSEVPSTANNQAAKANTEVDLFTFEPVASTAAASFDPFNTAPAPSPVVQSSNFDPFSSPAQPQANTNHNFDPFGSPSSSLPVSQNPTNPAVPVNFDPFGAAPQVPVSAPLQTAAGFDPFAASSQYQTPPVQSSHGMGGGIQQQQYPQYQQTAQPMQNTMNHAAVIDPFAPQPMQNNYANVGNNYSLQAPMQSFAPPSAMNNSMSPGFKPAPPHVASNTAAAASEFGDFETHHSGTANTTTTASASSKPTHNAQWGDMGNLVDLSGIAKNENKTSSAGSGGSGHAPYADNSFRGLDGFSKGPPSMVSIVLFNNSIFQ